MTNKRFSIITVTWNNADGLQRTLDSVRRLNYSEKELIVIDGASKDNTADVLAKNKDIITVAVSKKDKGIYNAMNKGLKYVTGDYVVFMNAGDCFASNDTLDIVSRNDEDIILGGELYGGVLRMVKEKMTLYDIVSIGLNHQAVYYKSDIIKRYGFDEKYKLIADFKSVVEPLAKEKVSIGCITEVLAVCEGGGLSKQRWRDTLIENKRIIEEVIDPFYRDDYVRFARINNTMLDDFIILSHFSSIFPVIKGLTKLALFINRHFKHIPL